jgi:hypothetical protein
MPFVQRQVEPKFISRSAASNKKNNNCGLNSSAPVRDNELETITNLTLSNAMRQLASLLALSKEIFTELNKELELVGERSTRIKTRLATLNSTIEDPLYDAKLVVVRKYLPFLLALKENHQSITAVIGRASVN